MSLIEKLDLNILNQKQRKHTLFNIQKSQSLNGQQIYKSIFKQQKFPIALTFDDVLLLPQYSEIQSRSHCKVNSFFSKNIPLNVPIISSPMDTVTQSDMAIGMAKAGGLGIIHRFLNIQDQAKEIIKVKRSGAFINSNPIMVNVNDTYQKVKQQMKLHNVKSFLVTNQQKNGVDQSPSPKLKKKQKKQLCGILTNRDITNFQFNDQLVKDFMTPIDKIIALELPQDFDKKNYNLIQIITKCKSMAIQKKIQKIPLINCRREIHGLICLKDIFKYQMLKNANKDENGKLYVGGAIGANKDYIERAQKLIQVGCDVLVVDVANGHSKLALQATQLLKDKFSKKIDIVAGSIATGEGAQRLIRSGADGVRCGIGNGSICITRIVAGSGVPQLTALLDTTPVCKEYQIPLCSDGGNRYSGNMCKALAIGADSIMVGRLVAGTDQSPRKPFLKDGKYVKMFRGMAGLQANMQKNLKTGNDEINPQTFNSEGVEGYIPYMGPLEYVIHGFVNGIKSGMSYSGASTIKQLQQKAKFVRITSSGFKQSHVHDINKI